MAPGFAAAKVGLGAGWTNGVDRMLKECGEIECTVGSRPLAFGPVSLHGWGIGMMEGWLRGVGRQARLKARSVKRPDQRSTITRAEVTGKPGADTVTV